MFDCLNEGFGVGGIKSDRYEVEELCCICNINKSLNMMRLSTGSQCSVLRVLVILCWPGVRLYTDNYCHDLR